MGKPNCLNNSSSSNGIDNTDAGSSNGSSNGSSSSNGGGTRTDPAAKGSHVSASRRSSSDSSIYIVDVGTDDEILVRDNVGLSPSKVSKASMEHCGPYIRANPTVGHLEVNLATPEHDPRRKSPFFNPNVKSLSSMEREQGCYKEKFPVAKNLEFFLNNPTPEGASTTNAPPTADDIFSPIITGIYYSSNNYSAPTTFNNGPSVVYHAQGEMPTASAINVVTVPGANPARSLNLAVAATSSENGPSVV